VVHAVNGTAVDAVESLRSTLEGIPDGAPIVLQVERAGMLQYVVPGAMPAADQRLKKTGLAGFSLPIRARLGPGDWPFAP
jgi:hypothetical protein